MYKNVNGSNFNDLIIAVLSSMFTKIGSTDLGGLLVNFFSSVFWFFGIHGNSVFEPVYRSVFLFEEGKIVAKYLFDCYSFIGGGGGTLALLIAILIFSKSIIISTSLFYHNFTHKSIAYKKEVVYKGKILKKRAKPSSCSLFYKMYAPV